MNRVILVTLLIAISCKANDNGQSEIIKPNWEIGDYRFYNVTGTNFARMKNDTIFSTKVDKTLKLTVLEKNTESYVIQVEKVSNSNIKLSTTIDSLKQLQNNLSTTFDFLRTLTKYYKPFKIRVTSNGELVDIVDFDKYYEQFMVTLMTIKDSVKIKNVEMETLKKIISTNDNFKERLRETLTKEVSDLFDIYNIKNPINDDVNKSYSIPNPQTGENSTATINYHTIGVNGDIQEIDATVNFEKSVQELFDKDTLTNATKKEFQRRDITSLTKYYFNTRTNWPENINQKVYFKTDTSEFNMEIISKTYR